ncbi:DUF3325 domain-containing protein [Tabrizicola sp.]|uniref:DUF3325 domain-containing protein n=1 Tax=Tabrizicola sp. TaxID=2005166 RepID=UPI003F3A2170
MMILVTFVLCCLGLLALAYAKPKHHIAALGQNPGLARQRVLAILGWTTLSVAIWAAMQTVSDWAIGLVLWVGALSVGGIVVTLIMTYGPKADGVARNIIEGP